MPADRPKPPVERIHSEEEAEECNKEKQEKHNKHHKKDRHHKKGKHHE